MKISKPTYSNNILDTSHCQKNQKIWQEETSLDVFCPNIESCTAQDLYNGRHGIKSNSHLASLLYIPATPNFIPRQSFYALFIQILNLFRVTFKFYLQTFLHCRRLRDIIATSRGLIITPIGCYGRLVMSLHLEFLSWSEHNIMVSERHLDLLPIT